MNILVKYNLEKKVKMEHINYVYMELICLKKNN